MAFAKEVNHHLMVVKVRLEELAEHYLGEELCNECKTFANRHPFVITTLSLTLLFSTLPIIFFLCFAVTSTLISLVCVLCVEGFLLLVGGVLLAGVVSCVAIISGATIITFALAHWFTQKFHALLCQHANARRTPSPQIPAQPDEEERQDADSSDS